MGSIGGFGLCASACGGGGGCHGFSGADGFIMAAGCKDFALGFTPVVRGGGFISEGDFRGGDHSKVCSVRFSAYFTRRNFKI